MSETVTKNYLDQLLDAQASKSWSKHTTFVSTKQSFSMCALHRICVALNVASGMLSVFNVRLLSFFFDPDSIQAGRQRLYDGELWYEIENAKQRLDRFYKQKYIFIYLKDNHPNLFACGFSVAVLDIRSQ